MKQYALADSITANEIKQIRKKLNLTQIQFAELVSESPKTES